MSRLNKEIAELKRFFAQARYIGVADGARENWRYLIQHTSARILDFYHASDYLAGTAESLFPGKKLKESYDWKTDSAT